MKARISLLSLLFLTACSDGDTPDPAGEEARLGQPWFEECASSRGLDFVHVSGTEPGTYLFPQIMGGGAALADLDLDGDLDAYLVQSGTELEAPEENAALNRLFLNDGSGNFQESPGAGGAADGGYGMGVALGDANGDGTPDLYVTNLRANALFSNDGTARFTDRTAAAGVGEEMWSVSAAFFDADNDGDLDLFATNYVRWSIADERPCEQVAIGLDYCSPKAYRAPAPDTFYRNEGDGTFTDRSSEAGFRTTFGNGLGVLCTDFDQNGWVDVFVANDGTVNQLWSNKGDGTFVDEAILRGVGVDMDGAAKAGMGVSAADLDDDGDEDLLVVNLVGESDSFYRNEGDFFSDRTGLAGLGRASRGYTRFGVAFHDFDNDGRLDLFEANGRVSRNPNTTEGDPYAEENLLFRQVDGVRFEEILPRGGTSAPLVATSRAAAFGDVDGDGGLDVLVVNRDAPVHLLRNVLPSRGRWIRLEVRNADGSHALGARLSIQAGPRNWTRIVRSAYSYDAASDPAVHLGLGSVETIEQVLVSWPDGSQQSFGPFEAGRTHTLRRSP